MEESTEISLSKSPETFFEFKPIKKRAISLLKKAFLPAFFVSLLLSFFGVFDGTIAPGMKLSFNHYNINAQSPVTNFISFLQVKLAMYMMNHPETIFLVIAGILAISLIIKFFIINPIALGGRKFFVSLNRNNESNFSNFGFGFSTNYMANLTKMIRRDLFLLLWAFLSWIWGMLLMLIFGPIISEILFTSGSIVAISILWIIFIILYISPFMVAFYSYKLVPYIIAENTDITGARAIEISKKVMYGYKWKLLGFELTFIGWYVLGILSLGLGVLVVNPYMDTSKAVLYERMRARAVKDGIAEYWELGYESDPFDTETTAI
jgi:uncharacterized membrane protein